MARRPFFRRFGPVILLIAAALVPLIGWGVIRAIQSNSNDLRDWLPSDYIETQQYAWFVDHFGLQDFIVASWPGCTLDDPRLDRFADHLDRQVDEATGDSPFRSIWTGRSLLKQLTGAPVELSRSLAVARLKGILIGPNGQQTCAVAFLASETAGRLEPAIEQIRQAAEAVGVPRSEVRLGGIPVVNAALNRESTNSLVRLASVSGLLGVMIAWLCFRDLRLTSLVLLVGVYSAALSLMVVPLMGMPLNAILMTMVPLVYVTSVSGAIHLSNYYLDALQQGGVHDAAERAVRHAAVPLLLATGTTVIGLLSLGYSDLQPIQLFGVFSAVGVGLGAAVQFLVMPAALAVLMPISLSDRLCRADPTTSGASHLGIFPGLGRWVVAHRAVVASGCLAVLCIGALGLPKIRTSIQLMRLFSAGTPIVPMTEWLEDQLGATIPLEVVVRFRPASQTAVVDRMRFVAATHAALRRMPSAGGCLSAATFAPRQINRATGEGFFRRAVLNSKLENRRELLREHGWIAQDGEDELWRISLRVRGVDDLDYAALVETIRRDIDPLRDAQLGSNRAGVELTITGTAPIVFKARQSLLDGMLFGLGTDIALIVIGVVLITRCWTTGVAMFLLSVFPTAVVFGAMGQLGILVDIGSVMTPCVAVGVTVDDVVHFLLWHRRGARQGMSAPHATLLAYATCGRAIFQSWAIIGIGLAAFALSSFVPTFRFGLLMLLLLTAGMLGNLLFLPALLAGPIGRRIVRGSTPSVATKAVPEAIESNL